jgi:aldose 1-epimerase
MLAAPSAERLRAGELEAVFLPEHGMLCASLRQRGVELLRRVEDLDAFAAKGSSAGIPLLHPWANRLDGLRYRALGREVTLDPRSALLHLDENGLPLHGVPWSRLCWEVTAASQDAIAARLAWTRPELLAVFPFPHRLELTATLRPGGLTFETALTAGGDGPVPVSFGFHPYLGLPDLPRERWRLRLPAPRGLVLDAHGIPTGAEQAFSPFDAELDRLAFDDGFAGLEDGASLSLQGAGREIRLELLAGFRCAQVYAPPGKDLVALEPMTAATNALASGRSLPLAAPGKPFRAAFRIAVGAA